MDFLNLPNARLSSNGNIPNSSETIAEFSKMEFQNKDGIGVDIPVAGSQCFP
jgi:hypothetical protein